MFAAGECVGAELSKSQIDRLGERLRAGAVSESDLRVLDEYRRAFSSAYESVVQIIRERVKHQPTARGIECEDYSFG